MAEDKRATEDRKRLEQEREKQEEVRKKLRGRPVPTQDEANQAKLGLHPELEVDGSEDPFSTKQVEAQPSGGGYSTRQSTAKPAG